MTKRHRIGMLIGVLALGTLLLRSCGSDSTEAEPRIFTVGRAAQTQDIREKLLEQEYVPHGWLFSLSMFLHGGYGAVEPGGYRLSANMSAWEMASVLTGEPQLVWVTIPEGLRKEQIADRLAEAFGWDEEGRQAFMHPGIAFPYGLSDGFYFPDTYLIPPDEAPALVAKRFINRFTDTFAPYVEKFRAANIKYDTAIILASLVQREAAGTHDMPLIAGVLWNRLLIKMPLQVDATLQYGRGDDGKGYWAPIDISEKKRDSPFNTYLYKGLPPSAIANPGVAAWNAVLAPEETECLYYLHAPDRSIHCSETYEGHLENIETYLR